MNSRVGGREIFCIQRVSNIQTMYLYNWPISETGNDALILNDAFNSQRSRGREFDPGPGPYFRGDWSWNNFYGHSPPSADLFKKGCCQLQAKVCAQITG